MRDNQKVAKWNRWIEQIENEIVYILSSRILYKGYGDIVRANEGVLDEGAVFHNWIVDNYVTFVAMAVRRQLDTDKDSISLVRLLTDIKNNPKSLTREAHVAFYIALPMDIGRAHGNRCFTENAGSGDFIDSAIVEADLIKLREASKKIGQLATRKIAHKSTKTIPSMTFNEVDECIEVIKTITRRYILLLRAADNILEPMMPDWQNIFTQKWIK